MSQGVSENKSGARKAPGAAEISRNKDYKPAGASGLPVWGKEREIHCGDQSGHMDGSQSVAMCGSERNSQKPAEPEPDSLLILGQVLFFSGY